MRDFVNVDAPDVPPLLLSCMATDGKMYLADLHKISTQEFDWSDFFER